jgi:hypothetical protein
VPGLNAPTTRQTHLFAITSSTAREDAIRTWSEVHIDDIQQARGRYDARAVAEDIPSND